MINSPRLYVGNKFERIVHPISLSISQNIIPLDTASITLPKGEELPARSWLELFTPYGSAGMFRVRSPKDAYGQETTSAELEHMISEVGDYVVKEEISEMLPANEAVLRLFKHYQGGKWKLGSIDALGTGRIACEAKYDRVLDDILAILEQKPDCRMDFDFSTTPWTINIVKKDTAVSAEGRLARNMTAATITCDDTELCTRVWYQTFDKNKKATWVSRDASTIGTYGIVEGTVRTSSDMTADEINATVDTYLAEHKDPRVSVNIQADELSQITGEKLDKFSIGKLMRIALPDYGLTVEETITSITWNDIYGNPRSVSINLGAEQDTVVTFLHNLDSKGAGGGGGGRAKDNKDKEWSEYIVQFDKLDDSVVGMVAKQDKQGSILEQAGMTLNSQGLLVYAKTKDGLQSKFDILNNSITSSVENAKAGLRSEIRQTADSITSSVNNKISGVRSEIRQEADRISLVVEGTGADAKVKAASIVAGINDQSGSYVQISADKINLSGYVTASQLSTTSAKIDNLMAGNTTAAWIKANQGNIPKLTVGNDLTFKSHGVYWQGVTINGTSYHFMGYVG